MEDKRRYGNEWLQIRGTFVEMEVVVVLVMVAVVVKMIVKKKITCVLIGCDWGGGMWTGPV